MLEVVEENLLDKKVLVEQEQEQLEVHYGVVVELHSHQAIEITQKKLIRKCTELP